MQQQQKRADLQQKQIEILQKTAGLLTDQVKTQVGEASSNEAIEKPEAKTELLESRAQQAAHRDLELANSRTTISSSNSTQKNATAHNCRPCSRDCSSNPDRTFLRSPSSAHWRPATTSFRARAAADCSHLRSTLLSSSGSSTNAFFCPGKCRSAPSGVSLGQAQADIIINDWLTMDIGYFLAPTGFWNERLDPQWINKLPDEPLVMRQVIPNGLVLSGLQFRGAKYLFGSPVKMEYSVFATNAMGVPGTGGRSDWADLGGVIGTTSNINNGMAYGGRIGFWIPTRGINFGVSEIVNAPYSHPDGAIISVWQPYFNYHYGNWDFRFEYGHNYERTKSFINNNINRIGFYTQLAYRNYQSIHKHLQRLEGVFRFSDARFSGIDQAAVADERDLRSDRPWTRQLTAISTRSASTTTSIPQQCSKLLMRLIKSFIET